MSILFVNWAYFLLGTYILVDNQYSWSLWENIGTFFLGYLIINHRECVYRKWGSYDPFQNLNIICQVTILESLI